MSDGVTVGFSVARVMRYCKNRAAGAAMMAWRGSVCSPDQSLQVQDVRQDPLQLASVRGQASQQVQLLLAGKGRPPFQGEGEAEHGGEGRPHVVRHRLQERVLQVVELPKALGRLTLCIQGPLDLRNRTP